MSAHPHPAEDPGFGRIAAWRARAKAAGERYEQAATAHPLLALPLVFLARYAARRGLVLASAVAFRLFAWLLPLALLLGGILAGTGSDGAVARTAADASGVTSTTSKQIATTISAGHRSWVQAVVIGGGLFVWASWTLIRALTAMNAIAWQAPIPKRHLAAGVRTAVTVATMCVVLIGGAIALARLRGVGTWGAVLAILLEVVAVAVAWLFVCLQLPDHRTSWTDLLPGSVLVGVGLSTLNAVGQIYIPLKLERASRLYGSLGIIGVSLAWLLIIAQVLVSATLINSVWTDYRHPRTTT